MVSYMKTTIDIAEGPLARAKSQAALEGVTLKSLAEEGLQSLLNERAKRQKRSVRPVTVSVSELHPEYQGADWNAIRAAAYEGAGS